MFEEVAGPDEFPSLETGDPDGDLSRMDALGELPDGGVDLKGHNFRGNPNSCILSISNANGGNGRSRVYAEFDGLKVVHPVANQHSYFPFEPGKARGET
jgi:hypothetical protein